MATLLTLPNELKLEVSSYLDLASLLSLQRTSRIFYPLCGTQIYSAYGLCVSDVDWVTSIEMGRRFLEHTSVDQARRAMQRYNWNYGSRRFIFGMLWVMGGGPNFHVDGGAAEYLRNMRAHVFSEWKTGARRFYAPGETREYLVEDEAAKKELEVMKKDPARDPRLEEDEERALLGDFIRPFAKLRTDITEAIFTYASPKRMKDEILNDPWFFSGMIDMDSGGLLEVLYDNGIDLGNDPNFAWLAQDSTTDMTMLHHAARWGKWRIAKVLLDKGGDPNKLDTEGFTPLNRAIMAVDGECREEHKRFTLEQKRKMYAGKVEVVRLLVKAGAEVNMGRPVIEQLVQHQEQCDGCDGWYLEQLITIVLEAGLEINNETSNGGVAGFLNFVLKSEEMAPVQKERILKLVFEQRPQYEKYINDVVSDSDMSVLGVALRPHLHITAETIRVLVENGADVHARDNNGITPVMWAAAERRRDLLEIMIPNDTTMVVDRWMNDTDGSFWNAHSMGRKATLKNFQQHHMGVMV